MGLVASIYIAFQLLLLNCTSAGSSNCAALYPTTVWISVKRDNELCAIIFRTAEPTKNPTPRVSELMLLLLVSIGIFIIFQN